MFVSPRTMTPLMSQIVLALFKKNSKEFFWGEDCEACSPSLRSAKDWCGNEII